MFSCYKADIIQYGSNTDPATFASGQQLPAAPKLYSILSQEVWVERLQVFTKYDNTF